MGSVLLDFIKNNPEDWQTQINEMGINTYWDDRFPGLCIFKYKIDADFNNPICMEARGIIIDTANLKVVCRPFDKFFEYDDINAAKIDWTTAHVLEKIDGTMVSLWYYEPENRWIVATMRFISADDPRCRCSSKGKTIYDLFLEALDDSFDESIYLMDLNKEATHVFELVSYKNQVVIKYDRTNLFYLTSRYNKSGIEFDARLHVNLNCIALPKSYRCHYKLDQTVDQVNNLNKEFTEVRPVIKHITHEGFVVVDSNYNRIKIKSPEWLMLHSAYNSGLFNKKRVVPLILNCKFDIDSIITDLPDYETFLRYYQFRVSELKRNVKVAIEAARDLYEKYNRDMKILGRVFSKSKYKPFMFKAINNLEWNAETIIKSISINYIIDIIEEYEPEKVVTNIYANLP